MTGLFEGEAVARFLAIGIALILAASWVGQVIGELHALYQNRKYARQNERRQR